MLLVLFSLLVSACGANSMTNEASSSNDTSNTSGPWGWGPERSLFTMESPATYPTFNSITDNSSIGDERNFVRIGEINPDETNLTDDLEIVPGKQYLVYIYCHNNASATFNSEESDYSGVATNCRVASGFSTTITSDGDGYVCAMIMADNANPQSVWDGVHLKTKCNKVLLRYVSGSAKIYNDGDVNGKVLSTNLFTSEGTLIGYNELNGIFPGCEQYHCTITYVLQAEEI